VNRLRQLNDDVNHHVSMTERGRRFQLRLGMLVLAKLPKDGLYVSLLIIFSVIIIRAVELTC